MVPLTAESVNGDSLIMSILFSIYFPLRKSRVI